MEQHPVPQNITSFEFRLIGEMTLKQFSLLAAGAISAYIFWLFPLPQIVRLPVSGLLAFLGIAFAFLPLEDRPLHRWFLAFLRSIYSPTRYTFQKSEAIPLYFRAGFPAITKEIIPTFKIEESRKKLEAYLKTLPKNLSSSLDAKQDTSLLKIQAVMETMASLPTPQPSPEIRLKMPPAAPSLQLKLRRQPAPPSTASGQPPFPQKKLAFAEEGRLLFEEERKTTPTLPYSPEKIADRSELLVEEIKKLKKAIANLRQQQPFPQGPQKSILDYEEKLSSFQKQLEQAEDEKENLIKLMLQLQREATPRPKGVTPTEILEKPQVVKIISAQAAKQVGLPKLTDIPNVVTGVIQDKQGNFLPNILVEIKNQAGDSVRAFKTNKLGQFAAATPLEKGVYTLEFEDPRGEFIFDIIEVKVEDAVLPPLAIYAKGQAEIAREQIHQALFGGN